jgi:hypothetical protein
MNEGNKYSGEPIVEVNDQLNRAIKKLYDVIGENFTTTGQYVCMHNLASQELRRCETLMRQMIDIYNQKL